MNMSISEIKKHSLRALNGKWGLAVQLSLLIFILAVIVPTLFDIFLSGGFSNWINGEQSSAGSILNWICSIAIIPFSIGIYWYFLSLTRFESPEITDVFKIYQDGKTSLKLIGTYILIGIFTFLWFLLFIIPGIIKSLAYSQTFFILRDHPEISVLNAITESRKRMKGYKWKYFLLNLSFIGWAILCMFTLGIGLLWLVPYISTAQATFYNELIFTQGENPVEDEPIV